MKFSLNLKLLGALAAVAMFTQPSFADTYTVDQSYTGTALNSVTVSSYPKSGEDFIPTLTGINYATFDFDSAYGTGTVVVEVYSGAGGSGTLLGSSNAVATAAGVNEFDFASTVTLTPGQTYSLVFDFMSGSGGVFYGGTGSGFYVDNGFYLGGDAAYSEGIESSSASVTPEPSSIVLLGTGLLLFCVPGVRRQLLGQAV